MRVLVLHSGGMDSTTCLYAAHRDGKKVFSLGVDYGQRLSVELLYAEQQCKALGVPREVISVSWNKPDRQIPVDRSIGEMRASISPAFLPARSLDAIIRRRDTAILICGEEYIDPLRPHLQRIGVSLPCEPLGHNRGKVLHG